MTVRASPSADVAGLAGRAPGQFAGLAGLLATTVGWGFGWPAMKVLVGEWPPLFARGVCGCAAAACLLVVCLIKRDRIRLSLRQFRLVCLFAALNVTSWMGCTALCLSWLPAGEGALVTYTMPIWAMLLGAFVLHERVTPRRVVAMILGIAGVMLIVASQGVALGLSKMPGVCLALFAAVSFALGSVLAKRTILPVPLLANTAWQIGLGCLPLLVAGGILPSSTRLGGLDEAGCWALLYMIVGPMAACYLFWYNALRLLPATTASLGTLLVPIVGILGSAVLIGERISVVELAATILTLGGVVLALLPSRRGHP